MNLATTTGERKIAGENSCLASEQGWAENSTPGIYRWNLPVFTGMANKAQVANTGKYNFLPRNTGKYEFQL